MIAPPQVGGIAETGNAAPGRIQHGDKDVITIMTSLIRLVLIKDRKIRTLCRSRYVDIAVSIQGDCITFIVISPPK